MHIEMSQTEQLACKVTTSYSAVFAQQITNFEITSTEKQQQQQQTILVFLFFPFHLFLANNVKILNRTLCINSIANCQIQWSKFSRGK